MKNISTAVMDVVTVVPPAPGGGGITTSGITSFINTQVIPVLLIAAAVMVIYFFIVSKQKQAIGLMAGAIAGIGFLAVVTNWQALSTWVAGLVGQ